MKRFWSAGMALLLLFVMFLPASASAWEVLEVWEATDDPGDDWNMSLDFPEFVCDGYPIYDNMVAEGGLTLLRDKYDKPMLLVAEFAGWDNLYTQANPEIVLSGHFGWKHTYSDYMDQYTPDGYPMMRAGTWRGVDWNIQVPGQGAVFHTAGLEKWDYSDQANPLLVKAAGLHAFDLEKLCAALGF